jgi:hypothetical protein
MQSSRRYKLESSDPGRQVLSMFEYHTHQGQQIKVYA